MIITCKECNSSFSVGDSLIKDSGTKVKCSKCDSVFFAYPPSPENELTMESEERPLRSDEDLSLEDLDASVDEFLENDEALATEISSEAETDELGLDLDLDLEDDFDEDKTGEEAASADELPDLGQFEDLAGLDDESLIMDDIDSDIQDLDLELESETITDDEADGTVFELEDDGALEEEDSLDLEARSDEDSDDLDFDLELDLESETADDGEIPEAVAEVEDVDELDLSDLELDSEDVSSLDEALEGESDDLEFDLDLDEEAEEIAGAQELDLPELEDIVDQKKAPVSEIQQDEESDDLVLEVEMQPGSDEMESDEIDLSDLEAIMESGETGGSLESSELSAEDLELDLDFQMDGEELKTDDGVAMAQDDELDFSDLEHMLNTDDTPEIEAAGAEEEEELDLQFDAEEQHAEGGEIETIADVNDDSPGDDLLDIEQMLEQSEEGAPPVTSEAAEDDLELPLEMEAALNDASRGAEPDTDLDFDLETEVQEKEELFDSTAAGDEQLESNLLTPDEVDYLNETGAEEIELQEEIDQLGVTADDFDADEIADEITEAAISPKSGWRKPVYVTLLLFFLAIGILIIPKSLGIKIPYVSDIKIPYLSDLDLKIPYLSDLLNPEDQDISGNLKIIPLAKTITCNFVTNSRDGQLLVIRGKIKNEYDQPRSFVRVTGKLYKEGNKLVKTATVYCGNVLSDMELAAMNIAAINKKMHNKFGDKKSNLKIKTGKMVPFMIVFDKLPQNLDEYTVEVADSSI